MFTIAKVPSMKAGQYSATHSRSRRGKVRNTLAHSPALSEGWTPSDVRGEHPNTLMRSFSAPRGAEH